MNKLDVARRAQVVAALVEGNSIRSTCRMTGVAKGTVTKLLVELGEACQEFHDEKVRNLKSRRIQCDEIWSFCGAKKKNVPTAKKDDIDYGDVWTWTAIDADSKLVPSWLVGDRDGGCAYAFIEDLKGRLANRVQLTTDGNKMYLGAVEDHFGADVDYAICVKLYGAAEEHDTKYSPARCIGVTSETIQGRPDEQHVSTSHVERQNLTMRMSMRRFTRLTNAFSKKRKNLAAAVALHFTWYNFGRKHMSLNGKTPAMVAGLADKPWTIEQIIGIMDPRAEWRKPAKETYRIVSFPTAP